MDDVKMLARCNLRFIEAWRQGSWLMLEPLLSRSFSCLDGDTGEVWDLERYREALVESPRPMLRFDQVVIHVAGSTGIVSARSRTRRGHSTRYLDTYARHGEDWLCVHACVWPLRAG